MIPALPPLNPDEYLDVILAVQFLDFAQLIKPKYFLQNIFGKLEDHHVAPMVKMPHVKLVITTDQWDAYRTRYNGACVKDLSRFPL